MKPRFLPIIFFLTFFQITAQTIPKDDAFIRYLSLQMTGKQHNVNFYKGSFITVKLNNDKQKYTFKIVQLTDSSFFYFPNQNQTSVFDLQELKFKEIRKVYLGKGKKSILDGIGLLGGAGVMLFSFGILNQLGNSKVEINPTLTKISAAMVASGLLIGILRNRTYAINKRHYFRLYHAEK